MATTVLTPEDRTARNSLGARFTALLTTTGLANLGDGIVSLGAPLIALTLTRSPVQISLLAAATWLPWLLLGLLAGAVVDRRDRRAVQVLALAARAGLLAVGCGLLVGGLMTMPALVGLVLAYGITEVFADLAQGALVPALVPADRLAKANGRLIAVQQVTNTFVGGPVAGVLLTLGAAWVFGDPGRDGPCRSDRAAPLGPRPVRPGHDADRAMPQRRRRRRRAPSSTCARACPTWCTTGYCGRWWCRRP